MTKLISSALTNVRPDIRWEPAADLDQAITIGMALAAPADPVLLVHLFHEKMDPVVSALYRLGAHGPLESHGGSDSQGLGRGGGGPVGRQAGLHG